MVVLQPFVPLSAILARCLIDSPLVRPLTKHCYMRCFWPAAAAASNPIAAKCVKSLAHTSLVDLAGFRFPLSDFLVTFLCFM